MMISIVINTFFSKKTVYNQNKTQTRLNVTKKSRRIIILSLNVAVLFIYLFITIMTHCLHLTCHKVQARKVNIKARDCVQTE